MTSTATAVLQWHDVQVTFDDDSKLLDAVHALDKDDALRVAAYNWANEGLNQPKTVGIEYLGVHDFQ